MKNRLSIVVGLLFTFISCDNSVTISKSEYDKLKGIKIQTKRIVTFPESSVAKNMDWEVIQGSDGHDYIENDNGSGYIMMHYVECNKCKKK